MANQIAAVSALLGNSVALIDELFTTDEERSNARLKLLELAHKGQLGQLQVNAVEAKSTSLFVAGWRPAVGWTCVTAFLLSFVVFPCVESIAVYISAFTGEYIDLTGLPKLDLATMMPVLMGMLGLGALRTGEKLKGVA